ncbi:MAG TPA: ATP-grasp domain-containing protein [Bacteroidota bacterium]|nr:ATP-grasp domain-containing protein [Bacteroidota bacterium]
MQKQLHVALVYNVRPENSPVDKKEIEEISEEEGAVRGGGDAGVLTASRTQSRKTKSDTYAEWDTEETILAVESALKLQHKVTLIEANEEACQKLLAVQPDIVFNIAEGFHGPSREAQIPAILDLLKIPYTGSDPVTLGICLDKSRTKEILSYHRVPTPQFAVIGDLGQLASERLVLPAIVKPVHEGSSKGISNASVVRTKAALRQQVENILKEYEEPVLVEKFLPGREFTVAVIGNGTDLRVLPIVEIRFDSLPGDVNPIYSYEAKWIWDQAEHPIEVLECPARVDGMLESQIKDLCSKTFDVLRCRDWCRIDIRLDEQGRPHVLEVNPLPGILPNPKEHSSFPRAARTAGFDYNGMINAVLDTALSRNGLR